MVDNNNIYKSGLNEQYGNILGMVSLVVAPSDGSDKDKQNADYVCDGVADDVQINAALASLTSGGVVTLTAGTFNIDKSIAVLLSDVWLKGSGWGTVIVGVDLDFSISPNIIMGLNAGSAVTKIRVSDLRINTPLTQGSYGVIVEDNVTYGTVENCYITASFGGVLLDGCAFANVINNYIVDVGDESIQTDAADDAVIMGNIITGNGQRAPQAAIRLRDSMRATVQGNIVSGCVQEAIRFEESGWNVVTGNVFTGNGTDTTSSEIEFTQTTGISNLSAYNIISNNIINATVAANAINEKTNASVHSNTIVNNVIKGAGIVIGSETTQVYGNETDVAYTERRKITVKNTSGGSLNAGDIVIADATGENYDGTQCTTTTTSGDDKVFGMALTTIADDADGQILTEGKTSLLKVNGTTDIAIGDFITPFTSAGIGQKAAAGDMAIAIALEAYTTDDSNGVIDALLVKPRKI
jgi:parallel beta-helix repeat protein